MIRRLFGKKGTTAKLENSGYCFCCDEQTKFIAMHDWLRDHYKCSSCGSIPRERALMYCLEKFTPNWRNGVVHESSPCQRGASVKLREAKNYIPSQYYPDVQPGKMIHGARCEDLESMTFGDNSIDLHVTQDVMEHIFHPDRAFKEIARTLRPGGTHVFTVPLVNKDKPTEVCAKLDEEGNIIHLREPEYHGNPISDQGSLVTRRWGYDICDYIFQTSGLYTKMLYIDALEYGIRAEYIEVLITTKPLFYNLPEVDN